MGQGGLAKPFFGFICPKKFRLLVLSQQSTTHHSLCLLCMTLITSGNSPRGRFSTAWVPRAQRQWMYGASRSSIAYRE